ncbi:Pheophorbide a oxygenase [Seminavis robusta]|uniref:Pheophorbide a oxygenase n=1 Tax=Seminavis robusta TaxID=568900 RepID=A0A9N8HZJ5_9STRA|nr:Pheophorbide a oxygenase [Seminavis robusta]|eukprot:Sro2938_g340640.1 Pheophorbide a oxygenase (325) ;mRNA; r:9246-10220
MAPIIPIPTFQAEVVDAAQYDPILMRQAKASGDVAVTKSWTTTIGYFGPSHVRYRRDRGDQGEVHVELFLCPTTEGKSRVFLFNVMVPGKQQPPVNTAKPHLGQKLWNNLKPSTWKQRMMKRILQNFFAGERGHLASHSIFDGDGIFLHKQGNRMKQAKKSYQDYSTPSSADILLNAYRRWLDQVAQKTRANGLDAVSQSVVGSNAYAADDDTARSLLLDRYNTHTKDCPLCLASLQKKRRQNARLQVLQTALQGATGASMTLFLVALAAAQASGVRLAPLLRALGFATAGTFGGSLWSRQQQEKLDKKINSFIFEDYIHAEKN